MRALRSLSSLETGDLFTYSIVVVDNDRDNSAQEVVRATASETRIAIRYCVEPRQGIALARNKAVENATGDFVAFLDDDEFPAPEWLLTLFRTIEEQKVDGVLGPVRPFFDKGAPRWVKEGGFYDRPEHKTGYALSWSCLLYTSDAADE